MRQGGQRRGRTALIIAGLMTLLGVASACSSGSPGHSGNTHSGPGSPIAAGPVARNLRVAGHAGSGIELVARTGSAAPTDPHAVAAVAKAEQAFSVALLHRLSAGSGQNASVSPASLAIALAMLQNGAAGQTRAQITDALQAHGIPLATQNAGWAGLVAQWRDAARSGGFALDSANSIWLQRELPVRQPFMTNLARYFRTGVWQVDFEHHLTDALAAINKWTSENTHGKIEKLFDQLDPATRLVLANAVYFKAAWQQPFDPSETNPGSFMLADGSTARAEFMSEGPSSMRASVGNGYTAVELPYQGGRFSALAIMPKSGTLNDFAKGLSASTLSRIASGLTAREITLHMPKFTTASTLQLGEMLNALGISDAFTDHADFSALSPQPLSVSQAIQRVYLSVAEKGTEAAAATGIGIAAGAIPARELQIDLDHPFLFLIRDTKTGAILFATEVQNPAAG